MIIKRTFFYQSSTAMLSVSKGESRITGVFNNFSKKPGYFENIAILPFVIFMYQNLLFTKIYFVLF